MRSHTLAEHPHLVQRLTGAACEVYASTSGTQRIDDVVARTRQRRFPASTRNAGSRQTDSQSTGVSRLRVSLGDDPQTFRSHVFGSVPVPQVVGATPAGQLHCDPRAKSTSFLCPHSKQSFVERKNRSTWTKCWLFHRALYATWRSSSPHATASHDFACLVPANAFRFNRPRHDN